MKTSAVEKGPKSKIKIRTKLIEMHFLGQEKSMRKMLVLGLFISLTPFAGADASAAATKLVIVHATINPSVTPLWITAEQGLFAKYGIDPEIGSRF